MNDAKEAVHDFWNQAACGETLYLTATDMDCFQPNLVGGRHGAERSLTLT
jgi:hypothetical protein